MTTPPDDLLTHLAAAPMPSAPGTIVAFSGGLDSSVLLHALVALRVPGLRACHVHHGLQAAADDWAAHCERVAGSIGVPLQILRVVVDPQDPAGPEAAARASRYAALRQSIGEGEVLATAHHRDDQAETVLLRLLRGSGVRGLSAIQRLSVFEPGLLWRPLLDLPRTVLLNYAQRHRLEWIDDPHNADVRYTRSWLRQQVMPQLRQRFAQLDANLSQAAAHAAETTELIDSLAGIDLADPAHAARPAGTLSVSSLLSLTPARRRNLLRHWLQGKGHALPPAAMIDRITSEVLQAGTDAEPCLHWTGCELRRYRDALFAMTPLPPPPPADWVCPWSSGAVLSLPPGCGQLVATAPPPLPVRVRLARAGERLRPDRQTTSRSFKNLFQEAGIPPWTRLRMPLIEHDGEPLLVPGLGLATHRGRQVLDSGWQVQWQMTSDGVIR
jgi:tRNA(Ile)-lysidine synthase